MNPRLGDVRNFLVYELSDSKEVIGCGQVRPGEPGELASLVVLKAWRENGVGSTLVEALLKREGVSRDLVLLCLTRAVGFYGRHGFREVAQESELPLRLRVERRIGFLLAALVAPGNAVVGMRRVGESNDRTPDI